MVDKKLSEFDEASAGEVSYFPVLDSSTKNRKLSATNAMPWTNCVTEIPQDIKLTLSNGTLTLKSGSIITLPNGTQLQTTSDKTVSYSTNGTYMLYDSATGGSIGYKTIQRCVSGSTDSLAGTTYHLWYDTTNNIVKVYDSSAESYSPVSFPLCIFTVSNGAISSIDQVFNGFGYIGSSVFALPGIKGLRPNGRNSDGTLKNVYWTCNSVVVRTFPESDNYTNVPLAFDGSSFYRIFRTAYSYNQSKNYNYNNDYILSTTVIGSIDETAGVVSNFNIKPAFHAVDYYDLNKLATEVSTLDSGLDNLANEVSTLDSVNVKTTGDQTIGGNKTFSGNATFNETPKFKKGTRGILNVNYGTNPTDTRVASIYEFEDNNGNTVGGYERNYYNTGETNATISVRKQDLSNHYATLTIGYDANQNQFVNASGGVKWGIARWAVPNYETASETGLGNISSGHRFTAPMDGTLHVQAQGTYVEVHISLVRTNDTLELVGAKDSDSGNAAKTVWIPVKGSQTYEITGRGSTRFYAFFCALSAGA